MVLLSHDHYDHADHLSIIELGGTVGHFIVPLGLAAHLQRWGVPPEKITELDWYDSHTVGGVKYVLTPSRHFSGRGISNRMSTLWGSWVVKSTDTSVWFSGDSGYFSEIKKIGELYGPFDIAFIENGAYSNDWKEVHMMPEQAVQATIDIQAKSFFPIHWGKFDLALHPWDEPVKRASNAASSLNVEMLTPVIGQVFAADERDFEPWWLIVQ